MSKTLFIILTFFLGFLVFVFYTACQGVQKQNTPAPNNEITAAPSEQGEVLPPPAIDDAILVRLKTERWGGVTSVLWFFTTKPIFLRRPAA